MLISLDTHPQREIEIGELMTMVVVRAANVVNDIRENVRNLVGGRMVHYEKLIDETITQAIKELEQKAIDRSYDGVIGIKISHPVLVDGGVEVVIYGNGFKYQKEIKQ